MTTPNRGYTPRTSRLLSEYLGEHYPSAKIILEFHLSRANPQAIAAMGGKVSARFGSSSLGYPDAAVITPGVVALWECKDRLTGAAIGQIEAYHMLWPLSVESATYPGVTVTMNLLVARADPDNIAIAQAKGINVVVYNPSWYQQSQIAAQAAPAVSS